MTTTYDPASPRYLVESDLREELRRVFDICHGCRLCFNLCPSFPTLFDSVDGHDGDVGAMSDAEQDKVVEECYQCKLCYLKCPYVPPHEWELDFPRLMMRAHAVAQVRPGRSVKVRAADELLGRSDLVGRVSVAAAPLVNPLIGRPGSLVRKAMGAVVGIHPERLLPPYARERFSTWFKRRPGGVESPRAEVSVFPTCFIEYMDPAIGKDLVAVYERNHIACSLPAGARCCGAPWLHMGDVARFRRVASANVAVLAAAVRAGRDVVVAQPTCAYVVKKDYPIYAAGVDADLVAEHCFDASEYLVNEHRRDGGGLDTDFRGERPGTIAYHLSCHYRALGIGAKGRDLLQLAGAEVRVVERCSGIDGTWGYRSEHYDESRKVARPLVRELGATGATAVCGDCHLANTAILEETGIRPSHPLQIFARAYGVASPSSR